MLLKVKTRRHLKPCTAQNLLFMIIHRPLSMNHSVFRSQRSADGAFNGALLLERGDPVSVIASAAGLTEEHLGASLPSPIPGRGSGLSPLPRATSPICVVAESARHVQGTSSDERDGCYNCGTSCETQHSHRPGQDVDQNTHENDKALRNNHGDRASADDSGGGGECHRAGKGNRLLHPWKLGNRPLALQMFERAAELGHPGAAQEIHRLKLREKFNHLEQMEKQSHLKLSV